MADGSRQKNRGVALSSSQGRVGGCSGSPSPWENVSLATFPPALTQKWTVEGEEARTGPLQFPPSPPRHYGVSGGKAPIYSNVHFTQKLWFAPLGALCWEF